MLRFFSTTSLIGLVLATLAGCNRSSPSVDPELLAEYRSEFALASEPDGVQTVLDVREAILGPGDPHEHDHAEHDHAEHDHAAHEHDDHEHAEHDHASDEHGDHEHTHEDHAHDKPQIDQPTEPIEVAMVGQIGGLANPWEETQPDFPFVENRGQVFIADPGGVAELAASGHVHAPGEECPFCAAHAADNQEMIAMVRFLDAEGKLVRVGVPEMFDVSAGDTVVVKGTARVVPGGMLVVDAEGLYVRR